MINWDGCGEPLARGARRALRLSSGPRHGLSDARIIRDKYGVEQNREVITFEVPYLMVDERGWTDCRAALRWCVDLPD